MSLEAERPRDLGPAPHFGLIDRYLPAPYRRALSRAGDPMAALTRAGRAALRQSLGDLDAVQRSRAVEFFDDLTDGALLGALHDQTPWPEDDAQSFRARLLAVSALALRGAASAERMLALCALAGNGSAFETGTIARPIAPNTAFSFELRSRDAAGNSQVQAISGHTAPGQTRQYFTKPERGGLFAVDLFDAPLRRFAPAITPLPGAQYRFALDNPASETLPGLDGTDPVLWPDPVFTITAGARPFGPFALVQTGSAQVLVVNRVLAPGARLHVDARAMVWAHDAVGSTALGKLTCRGRKEALYAGFALSADDHLVAAPDAATPTGPLLSLRAKAELRRSGALPGGPPKDADALAAVPLDMPSWLGKGRSQWRVVQLGAEPGDVHAAQSAALPSDTDVRFAVHWFGRRPGEFAIALPASALAPDQSGPRTHRRVWLDAMIARFKLAGTVRIAQDLLFSQNDILIGTTELHLRARVAPRDVLEVDLPATLQERTRPTDRMTLLPQAALALASAARPVDRIEMADAGRALGTLASGVAPTDAMELQAAQDIGPLRSAARPVDSMTLDPGAGPAPEPDPEPDPGPDPAPRRPGAPLDLRSAATPNDRMTLRRTRQ